MAKNVSRSDENLTSEEIANIYNFRIESLRLFFSPKNPEYAIAFIGFSQKEVDEELKNQIQEVEKDSCLNILASIEALFRLDYDIRCRKRDKSDLTKKFRTIYKSQGNRISLEDTIFEEWKVFVPNHSSIISQLKAAFKYRHWLAHGRYWILKAGKSKYDFYELYKLSLAINLLPLKLK